MPSNRTALALLAVGLLLLPSPMYASAVADATAPERHRTPTGYVAEPIDAGNDSVLVDRYADRLSFDPDDLTYRHVADDYRAPNRTRETLGRAVRNGTATAGGEAVRADVRRIARNHTFLTLDHETYHSFAASDGRVRTTPANESAVAGAVSDELIVAYEDLPPGERATFRKIRNATASPEAYDYRPWSDEPLPDEPIVERNGSHYAVRGASVTDDFNLAPLLVGLAGTVSGAALVLAAGGVWLYGRLSD